MRITARARLIQVPGKPNFPDESRPIIHAPYHRYGPSELGKPSPHNLLRFILSSSTFAGHLSPTVHYDRTLESLRRAQTSRSERNQTEAAFIAEQYIYERLNTGKRTDVRPLSHSLV